MPDLGIDLPAGTRLVSLAERPDLRGPVGDHNVSVWPEFMLNSAVANRNWDLLFEVWPDYQLVLLDADGLILAAHNSAPLSWDGTDAGLPDGWEDQFEWSVAHHRDGTESTALGALQIVVGPRSTGDRPRRDDAQRHASQRALSRAVRRHRLRPADAEARLPAHADRAVRGVDAS